MTGALTPLGHQAYPSAEGSGHRVATLEQRLRHEKENLEARLHKINSVLDALDAQPDTKKILDMISELGGF